MLERPTDALTQLNGDVLLKLFEVLRTNRSLRSLSSTCHWLREASAPVLFRSCLQLIGIIPWRRMTYYEILPSTLWTHVRTLQLMCGCGAYSQRDPSVVDPLLCSAFDTIDAALPALPHLTTLRLRVQSIDVHGIPWNSMRTILSLPNLRHLHIDRFYVCPELIDGDNLEDATVTPLTTFHYTMPNYRQPWSFPSEVATLDFLVRKLHTSLERLVLPAESAPIQTISSLQWPRLQEFTLRGERWSDPETPILSLFSSMSSLRSLTLQLSDPENTVAAVVWPRDLSTATFPWPGLESLRVSQPGPADDIYAHLPPSLRALSLRSWPHEGIRIYDELRAPLMPSWLQGYRERWQSYPLPTPRNLAQVIQKCELPLLPSLELEYRVDAQESELLHTLTAKFPHLTTLEVHRLRSQGSYEVVVTEFAEGLAPLTSLRVLKLHLDFAYMTRPDLGLSGAGESRLGPLDESDFEGKLQRAAEELSRTLAPSLEEIWMFRYRYKPMWAVFVVTRGVGPDGEPHTEVVLQKDEHPYVY